MRRGPLIADLEHWHYDTFAAYHRSRRIGFDTVTFIPNGAGGIRELVLVDVEGFKKAPEPGEAPGHHD